MPGGNVVVKPKVVGFGRKKKFRKKRSFKPGMNEMVQRLVRQAKPEYKRVTIAIAAGSLTSTYAISNKVDNITQGVGSNNRQGDRIKVMDIVWKGYLVIGSLVSQCVNTLMCVVDHHTNGTVLAAADMAKILEYTSAGLDSYSPRQLDYMSKYEIVWHKVFNLNSEHLIADFDVVIKFNNGKGLVVNYSGNTGTIADVTEKSIYLIAWSNTAGGGAATTLTHSNRIRFIDL